MFFLLFHLSFSVSKAKITPKANSCDLCNSVIDYLLDHFDESSKLTLCNDLPSPASISCNFLVNNYLDIIKNDVKSGLKKSEICNKYGFCTSHMKRSPALDNLKKYSENSNTQCEICTYPIVPIIEEFVDLGYNSTVIMAMLTMDCPLMDQDLAVVCEAMIQYVPLVIQMYNDGVEEKEICAKLGFCPDNTRLVTKSSKTKGRNVQNYVKLFLKQQQ